MDTELKGIIAAVATATERRNAKRDEYAARLERVIEAALDAVKVSVLEVAGHRIASERVTADCSQWSNQVDYSACEGRALLVDRESSFGAPPDLGFHDGQNMQYQQSPTTCGSTRVRPCSVGVLLEIGAALPGVLGPLLATRLTTLSEQTASLESAPVPA